VVIGQAYIGLELGSVASPGSKVTILEYLDAFCSEWTQSLPGSEENFSKSKDSTSNPLQVTSGRVEKAYACGDEGRNRS